MGPCVRPIDAMPVERRYTHPRIVEQWPGWHDGAASAHQGRHMQESQPRDFGVLALVVGLFIILLLVTVLVGAPAG